MGGNRCTICDHAARVEIDKILATGKYSDRVISGRFGLSKQAVQRHRTNHLPKYLARTVRARELVKQEKVLERLENRIHEVEMLLDACHEYLLDPDDPSRYFLGPRAEEIEVVYLERELSDDGTERIWRRRAKLSALLDKTAKEIDHSKYRIADPRRLILEAEGKLESILETVARIAGFIPREPKGQQTTINLQMIYQLMPNIVTALRGFPEAMAAVMAELEKAMDQPGFPHLEGPPANAS